MSDGRNRARVLLLDDDGNDRSLAVRLLAAALPESEIETALDSAAFDARLSVNDFDLLITERRLGWTDSAALLERMARHHPDCPVIVLTHRDPAHAVDADLERGAFAVVFKDSAGLLQLPHLIRRAMAGGNGAATQSPGVLERVPVGIFRLGRDGQIREANRSAVRILGLETPGDAEGLALSDRLDSHPAQRRLQLLLDGGSDHLDMETRLRRPDGENLWVRLRAWPATSGNEFEGALENISDYKKTEAELARQAAELGRSNAELEQFAYVVSHDLQEPLSLIRRYAELLTEDNSVTRDGDSGRHLERVLESSRRMQTMIDGILEYSRVETKGTPFGTVDFGEVVEAAVENLDAARNANDARIEHKNLPTLNADRGQMLQLFQNLIGNALKFHDAKRPCRVKVSARETREHWRFTVQDNGIGVDPDARDRIFGMFQRLHTGDEVPGTGIGLAICRSIVQRHGGEIWVDSVPGEGSSFHFTISRWL